MEFFLDFGFFRLDTTERKKNTLLIYRELILFYHKGKGLLGGPLANFFVDVLGGDRKSNESPSL